MNKKEGWSSLGLLLCCMPLHAQMNETIDVRMQKVEVVETVSPMALESLRIITTLSKDDIKKMPVHSVGDLLDYLPGIDVRSRGRDGVQADISMRGGTFDQVIVLLNGVNITDPHTGHHNLNLPVDVSNIERIEVLQGTSMAVFGLSSFCGAINIITTSQENSGAEVGLTAGSHGYVAPFAAINTANDHRFLNASVSNTSSSGYIDNTDFNYTNLYAQAGVDLQRLGSLKAQLGGQLKEYGANAFYSTKYPHQFEATKTLLSSLQWEKEMGRTKLSSTFFYRAHYDEFQLFRYADEVPTWYTNHNYHISQVLGANLQAAYQSNWGRSVLGLEVRNEDIVSNVLGDALSEPRPVPFASQQDVYFTFGKNRFNLNYFAEQSLVLDRLTASLGVSGNYNSMYGHNLCWGANVGYRLSSCCRVYANANNSWRLPTFTDVYYKSATQLANPDLRPEESMTFELGVKGEAQRLSYRGSAYYRIGRDIIDWARTSDDEVWKSMNIDQVNALGAEASLSYRLNDWLKKLEIAYAFCRLNKDSGRYISKYAMDYLNHSLMLSLDHAICQQAGIHWVARYQEREGSYVDAAGQVAQYRPFVLVDAQGYWQLRDARLFIEATNLLDTHYYDYGGIEQPGRQIRVGIRLSLSK